MCCMSYICMHNLEVRISYQSIRKEARKRNRVAQNFIKFVLPNFLPFHPNRFHSNYPLRCHFHRCYLLLPKLLALPRMYVISKFHLEKWIVCYYSYFNRITSFSILQIRNIIKDVTNCGKDCVFILAKNPRTT